MPAICVLEGASIDQNDRIIIRGNLLLELRERKLRQVQKLKTQIGKHRHDCPHADLIAHPGLCVVDNLHNLPALRQKLLCQHDGILKVLLLDGPGCKRVADCPPRVLAVIDGKEDNRDVFEQLIPVPLDEGKRRVIPCENHIVGIVVCKPVFQRLIIEISVCIIRIILRVQVLRVIVHVVGIQRLVQARDLIHVSREGRTVGGQKQRMMAAGKRTGIIDRNLCVPLFLFAGIPTRRIEDLRES